MSTEEEEPSEAKTAEESVEDAAEERLKKQKEIHPLLAKMHAKYFVRVLNILPGSLKNLDSNRMTLAFFGISGLDVLGVLDTTLSAERRKELVDWIYSHQILPGEDGNMDSCGFRGSNFIGAPFHDCQSDTPPSPVPYDTGHVAMTYTALACLLILGDDLSRVNRAAVLAGVRSLQLPNGSFYSTAECSENDMRFVYCAACICYILRDWSAMDIEKAVHYIRSSKGYDDGLGQGPFLESHGGSTFCAIAALVLMGQLETAFSSAELEAIRKWCLFRQRSGFQGRPNKPADTCYSFWVGATLKLLGASQMVNKETNRGFIITTQADFGGLAKWPDYNPDPLHTYLGVCGLSLNGEEGLRPVHAALNISQRAAEWLDTLHARNS